jgi:hypothetical protein
MIGETPMIGNNAESELFSKANTDLHGGLSFSTFKLSRRFTTVSP